MVSQVQRKVKTSLGPQIMLAAPGTYTQSSAWIVSLLSVVPRLALKGSPVPVTRPLDLAIQRERGGTGGPGEPATLYGETISAWMVMEIGSRVWEKSSSPNGVGHVCAFQVRAYNLICACNLTMEIIRCPIPPE